MPPFKRVIRRRLDPTLLGELLAGVQAQEQKTFLESALTSQARLIPVFTFSEIRFLAPLLSSGLEQALPGEAVHFSLQSAVSGREFDVAGMLYVSHNTITFSLSQYGLATARPSLSRPSRSFDRSKRWTIAFAPPSALISASAENSGMDGIPGAGPLIINLTSFAEYLEATAPRSHRPESAMYDQETPEKFLGIPRHSGKESVEKEIHQLRQSMQEQEKRLEQLEHQLKEGSPPQ